MSPLLVAAAPHLPPSFTLSLGDLGAPSSISSLMKVALVMTALAVLPSILMMFTSFVRLIVVLHFLRQAMGTQNVPPNQVLVGLALMLTFFIMAPVGEQVYSQAVVPYQAGEMPGDQALQAGLAPVKEWMLRNTRETDLTLFAGLGRIARPASRAEIPLRIVMPAFLISELKTGFQIGFLLFLPFLVIDLVVSSVLMSMGMMMLPPVIISFPFKILLFVMVDGWDLLIGSVVRSFAT
ncbi:MAG TPA: flagellar type III secretion system pore protein FliP [Candidatus Polarisedimenticolia bacterium]|nr:flagellar type III secretion system pore protein FliP [Candidatus Polarisedimenticolia bacterium]